MALGELEYIIQDIHNATSDKFELMMNSLPPADRTYTVAMMQEQKDALTEYFSDTNSGISESAHG